LKLIVFKKSENKVKKSFYCFSYFGDLFVVDYIFNFLLY
jgi:hypothetical protein